MLKNKTAIVTGSTSGIGLGIARSLGAAGANLMLNGFGDAAQIEALRAGLAKEFGVKVGYSGADMSRPEQIHAMVQAAVDGLGGLDILVNNAGIQHTAPVESFPAERWDAIRRASARSCSASGDASAARDAWHRSIANSPIPAACERTSRSCSVSRSAGAMPTLARLPNPVLTP